MRTDSPEAELPELVWHTVYADVGNVYEEVVRPHVIEQGSSARFQAPPGVGKARIIKLLCQALRAEGHFV